MQHAFYLTRWAPRSIRLPLPRFVPPMSSTPVSSAPLRGIELCAGVELRIDEPPFVQAASRCYAKSACCNSMFQVFQMYVASVVYQCCKNRLGCYTCCNGYTRIFQVYVSNVLSILDEYCKSFTWMLHIHVANICFKCFQVFHTYVYEYFIWMLHIFVMVSNIFEAFPRVFQTFVSNGSLAFFCMLQLLHLNISTIDRTLHMIYAWKIADDVGDGVGGAGLCTHSSLMRYTLDNIWTLAPLASP
jgi:hypothetical protein